METVLVVFITFLVGFICGIVLRSHLDGFPNGGNGGTGTAGGYPNNATSTTIKDSQRTVNRAEQAVTDAERTNTAAGEVITKMENLLNSVRNGGDHNNSDMED